MKKIPALFKKEFVDHTVTKIFPEVTPGLEWVLQGEGIAAGMRRNVYLRTVNNAKVFIGG